MSFDGDEATAPRLYETPHHYDWIDRFLRAVQRAVKLAEPVDVLPPEPLVNPQLPLPAPVASARIKLGERGWQWPLEPMIDGRRPTISDGYHPKGDMRFRNGVGHRGCDLMFAKRVTSAPGAPLNHPWESRGFEVLPRTRAFAVGPGRVTVARWLVTGYGVAVDHGFGVETAYHHMSSLLCAVGDELKAGSTVGVVGGPPAVPPSTRPGLVHLHLDLLIGGKFVDPEPYLKTWPFPRPLTTTPPFAAA